MGLIVSTLRNCCLGREKNEKCVESHLNSTDIKTAKQKNENCVEDTESKKINLDYSCLQYDELSTPIRYYILRHQLQAKDDPPSRHCDVSSWETQ